MGHMSRSHDNSNHPDSGSGCHTSFTPSIFRIAQRGGETEAQKGKVMIKLMVGTTEHRCAWPTMKHLTPFTHSDLTALSDWAVPETKAQGSSTCPRSHGQEVPEPGFDPIWV